MALTHGLSALAPTAPPRLPAFLESCQSQLSAKLFSGAQLSRLLGSRRAPVQMLARTNPTSTLSAGAHRKSNSKTSKPQPRNFLPRTYLCLLLYTFNSLHLTIDNQRQTRFVQNPPEPYLEHIHSTCSRPSATVKQHTTRHTQTTTSRPPTCPKDERAAHLYAHGRQ